jgi:methionyl-tRNA formyltransferase
MPFSVVFCGTSAFAIPSLQALAGSKDFSIECVITQPDKPAGRGKELAAPPVKLVAQELGLTIEQPENINKSPVASRQSPDFLIVISYGQILSQAVLDFPKIAPINVHASLLPRWRGASPIQQALLAGDEKTGVTVQRMVRALDAGPILGQKETTIAPRETAATLHDRLASLGAILLLETLRRPLEPKEQDGSGVTVCGKIFKHDGVIDPKTMTAVEIDRKVRALTPWPGVTGDLSAVLPGIKNGPVKILDTSLEFSGKGIEVPCRGNSTLTILTVQEPSRSPVDAHAWLQGARLR